MNGITPSLCAALDYDLQRLHEGAKQGKDVVQKISRDIFDKYHLDLLGRPGVLKLRDADLGDLATIRDVALKQLVYIEKHDSAYFQELIERYPSTETKEALFISLIYQMAAATNKRPKQLQLLSGVLFTRCGIDLLGGLCIVNGQNIKTSPLEKRNDPKALFTRAESYHKLLQGLDPEHFKTSEVGSFEKLAAAAPSHFLAACHTFLVNLIIAIDNFLKCLHLAHSSFAERSLNKEMALFTEGVSILKQIQRAAETNVTIESSHEDTVVDHLQKLMNELATTHSHTTIERIKEGFHQGLEKGKTLILQATQDITTSILALSLPAEVKRINKALKQAESLPFKESLQLLKTTIENALEKLNKVDKSRALSGHPDEPMIEL